MSKKVGLSVLIISVVMLLALCTAACGEKTDDVDSNVDVSSLASSAEAPEVTAATVLGKGTVVGAGSKSNTYGTVVEKLSTVPFTEASAYTVRNARNYKWIAYDNYTLYQRFEDGTKLAKGGYLFYIELPKTDFDHEMYFEFFADSTKIEEYSGEVAFTESEKTWYCLPDGAVSWEERTTSKYKLIFGDGGEEFKGYVFIPSDALTYRYESESLSDICIYVKSGVETMNDPAGKGIDFTISAVVPVDEFDASTTLVEAENGIFDLSK